MKSLQIGFIGMSIVFFLNGCTTTWHSYSPPMSDIIGNPALLNGNEITIIGEKIHLENDKNISLITKESSNKETEVTNNDKKIVLDFLYKKILLKLGINTSSKKMLKAEGGIKIDVIKNWIWINENRTFVYAGARANKVIIDINTSKELSLGKIQYDDIGDLSITGTHNNVYHIEINNPKVYYKVQLAKVKEVLSDRGDGWISDKVKNPNLIRLGENEKRYETEEIKAKESEFKFLNKKNMPKLSLRVFGDNLYLDYKRGRKSEKINLSNYMKHNIIHENSIYIASFPIEDLREKFILLDIKAKKENSTYIITHARIRYPEYKLEILKK